MLVVGLDWGAHTLICNPSLSPAYDGSDLVRIWGFLFGIVLFLLLCLLSLRIWCRMGFFVCRSLIFFGVASHSFGGYRKSPYLVSSLVCWFVQDLMHIQRCDSPGAKVLMSCFNVFWWLGFGFLTFLF
jgi:hypothetical protein